LVDKTSPLSLDGDVLSGVEGGRVREGVEKLILFSRLEFLLSLQLSPLRQAQHSAC